MGTTRALGGRGEGRGCTTLVDEHGLATSRNVDDELELQTEAYFATAGIDAKRLRQFNAKIRTAVTAAAVSWTDACDVKTMKREAYYYNSSVKGNETNTLIQTKGHVAR